MTKKFISGYTTIEPAAADGVEGLGAMVIAQAEKLARDIVDEWRAKGEPAASFMICIDASLGDGE